MPNVATTSTTGNPYIDGLLGDYKWAVNAFTFSFPTNGTYYGSSYSYYNENNNNFGALNTTQQAVVRTALQMFASVANLAFSEIKETSSEHGDLRFAMSDAPNTAWAYFPTTSAVGGDAWFNRSKGYYNSPEKGNYAYLTFMHEIGHALGLEHAHESGMPSDHDSMEYTVMSYRSYVGASTTSGYVNETWGYAQSLMMYDIAALQHMYGANFSTNSGGTRYSWSPATGEMFINGVGQGAPGGNQIFATVWDGGGTDTYDFSNYSAGLKIDLRPGEWTTTSSAQVAKLHWDGSKVAAGNIANALLFKGDTRSLIENAVGGSGNDALTGNQVANSLKGGTGNDRLTGHAGNDVLDGGIGDDTAVYGGQRSQYNIAAVLDGSVQIADLRSGVPDGKDIVWSIEWLQFADRVYSLSEVLSAGNAADLTALRVGGEIIEAPQLDTSFAPVSPVAPDLYLTGGKGKNALAGGAGNDKLNGGYGNDVLSGFAGKDMFVFDAKLGTAKADRKVNFDTITDFSVADDTIWLDNRIFKKLGRSGSEDSPAALKKAFFKIGSKAKDKNDYILYNKKTGILSYDADGSGSKQAIEFAKIAKNLKLIHDDFKII